MTLDALSTLPGRECFLGANQTVKRPFYMILELGLGANAARKYG